MDKEPLAFFIYLFGLFIPSVRGKHNNSLKTWFCQAAQQERACKKASAPFPTHWRVSGRIAPCLQCRGRSTAGGSRARGQRSARDPAPPCWAQQPQKHSTRSRSASDISETPVRCHEWFSFAGEGGSNSLHWLLALWDSLACVPLLWRGNGFSAKPERHPLLIAMHPKPFWSFP